MNVSYFSKFFCTNEFSLEWFVYFIIILALISFFIISCYNIDKLVRFHNEDVALKNGVNIAIECVVIFIGIFLFVIWYRGKITKLQLCFCGHVSIFLILTGIAALSATSKRIQK